MTGFELDSSLEAAARVLHGLFGWAEGSEAGSGECELVEVSAKSPGGKWRSVQVEPEDLWSDTFVKEVNGWSAMGREMYVGCVGLVQRPEHPWRRGSAALRGRAGALWLDVDVEAPGREGPEYFGSVTEAVKEVDEALGPVLRSAALVLGSGWGCQYWIPLRQPVPGRLASSAVRALVGAVAEATEKKIDRVWDVTRVMRMPGTYNWRAGLDPDTAVPTGVIRWPGRVAEARLDLDWVIETLGRQVEPDGPSLGIEGLLARYGGIASGDPDEAGGGGAGGAGGGWVGGALGDLDALAEEVLTWEDVLLPAGWRRVSDPGLRGREEIWERPGKPGEPGAVGERSAVVYADKPALLVVYSDSSLTGFSAGLRGSGARGDGAGVGVISKWRAWVDLAWAGDEREAAEHVQTTGEESATTRDEVDGAAVDAVTERLARAWMSEMSWVQEWARDRALEAERRASGMLLPGET